VAIIGAGPAGCSAALALQGSGLSVALLEKAKFPRDKICGDAIPGPAFKVMRQINPQWGEELLDLKPHHTISFSELRNEVDRSFKIGWKDKTYNARRIDFDNHLWAMVKQHTHAALYENTAVIAIKEEQDRMLIQTANNQSFRAKMIIGADGANGVTVKQLTDLKIDRNHHSAAVRAYFTGVENIKNGENIFYGLKNYIPGYFWIFPLGDGRANVGFGMLSDYVSKHQFKLRKVLLEIIAQEPVLQKHFKNAKLEGKVAGFGLPLGSRFMPLSGDRFLLCGDAGSLIEPIQGHGIDTAMYSAKFAADVIKEAFAKSKFDADFLKQYDKKVYQKYKMEFKRNYFLLRMVQKMPAMIDVGMFAFNNRVGKYLVNRYS